MSNASFFAEAFYAPIRQLAILVVSASSLHQSWLLALFGRKQQVSIKLATFFSDLPFASVSLDIRVGKRLPQQKCHSATD